MQFLCIMDDLSEMADLVVPEYSKSEIVAVGKALKGNVSYGDEAVRIFRIAHNWREAHLLPMRRIRRELTDAAKGMRRSPLSAVTAARIKRMKSIRKKLRTSPYTLYQMQDIGGCRGILNSISEVHDLIKRYKDGLSRHGWHGDYNYIDSPKNDGYRSYHLILKFSGYGAEEIYNRQRIEVQLRTKLQHVWATAIEAAGLVRGEDLKGGTGSADWLRLFQIMSSEFAILENCPLVPGVSENEAERRDELRHLNNRLGAAENLNNWNAAIQCTDQIKNSSAKFFIIQYDNEAKSVTVRPSTKFLSSAADLIREEEDHGSRDTVLVELDRAQDLKSAYPNYFLDVREFGEYLADAVAGRKLILNSQQSSASVTAPDMSKIRSLLGWWKFGK